MKSDLYYECHITIEPVFGPRLELLKEVVRPMGFRVADLLMLRNREATPERSEYDTFCTTRGKDYEDIVARMEWAVDSLQNCGFDVWRYKVEDTLLDVRVNNAHADVDDDLLV